MKNNTKPHFSNLSILAKLIKEKNLVLTNLKQNGQNETTFYTRSISISNLNTSFIVVNNSTGKIVDNLTNEEIVLDAEIIEDILTIRHSESFEKFKSFYTFKIINLSHSKVVLNASSETNFIFKIENLNQNKLDEINAIDTATKLKDRIIAIENQGGVFKYIGAENDTMTYNLKMVDSSMPEIIGYILYTFYKYRISSISKLVNIIDNQIELNKKINYIHKKILKNKVQRLLVDMLLGFFTEIKWNGDYQTSGIIVVKQTGDYVGFHLCDLKNLREYLYKNIKLDTPSTTRHRYGKLFLEADGQLYFKLNLQLRF